MRVPVGLPIKMKPEFYSPSVIPKAWGEELWIRNTEKYCGKILRFKPDAEFSLHFHVKKEETWYVSKGTFILTYIETNKANRATETLREGAVVHLKQGVIHKLHCISKNGGEIFEVSTEHFDDDSYRIEKGDSQ